MLLAVHNSAKALTDCGQLHYFSVLMTECKTIKNSLYLVHSVAVKGLWLHSIFLSLVAAF